MSDLKNWNSKDFSITAGTVDVSTGRGGGVFCTIKANAEDYTPQVGADGETTLSRTNDTNGTVELTVMRSSKAHRDLHALRALGLASANGGAFDFQANDRSNGLIFASDKAKIMKRPDETGSKESGEATWTLFLVDMSTTVAT